MAASRKGVCTVVKVVVVARVGASHEKFKPDLSGGELPSFGGGDEE